MTVNHIWNSVKGQVRLLPFCLFALLPLFYACSEDDDSVEEFADWQARNETYWNNLYQTAQTNADGRWKILHTWSKDEGSSLTNTDYVVVHVETEGTGSGCPLYTDSVRVHYAGRLIPSESNPEGFQFDESYSGTSLDVQTDKPREFYLGETGLSDGFRTALLYMHIGDRWTVYIPYTLGYGTATYDRIPGYSTLIFDLTLAAYYRPGATIPEWKAKRQMLFEE